MRQTSRPLCSRGAESATNSEIGAGIALSAELRSCRCARLVIAYLQHGWPGLETGPRYQQNCTDCHKENARPVRFEPQESHAAPWRLQSVANRPGGIWATQRSLPNSSACHVQDSAENEQRAKHHQEHSRPSIHRRHAQQNLDSSARRCDSFRCFHFSVEPTKARRIGLNYRCGALAPRNRSTNQNAQIATKQSAKIPPHARKVDP